jgi:hypothetical protein
MQTQESPWEPPDAQTSSEIAVWLGLPFVFALAPGDALTQYGWSRSGVNDQPICFEIGYSLQSEARPRLSVSVRNWITKGEIIDLNYPTVGSMIDEHVLSYLMNGLKRDGASETFTATERTGQTEVTLDGVTAVAQLYRYENVNALQFQLGDLLVSTVDEASNALPLSYTQQFTVT